MYRVLLGLFFFLCVFLLVYCVVFVLSIVVMFVFVVVLVFILKGKKHVLFGCCCCCCCLFYWCFMVCSVLIGLLLVSLPKTLTHIVLACLT